MVSGLLARPDATVEDKRGLEVIKLILDGRGGGCGAGFG